MAFKSFFHLGNNTCKCVFMSIQFKSKLCIIQGYTQGYRQIRNIHKLRGRTKLSISNDFVNKQSGYTSSLWKPFTFTIVFSATTFIAAAIWEYEHIRKKTYSMIRNYKQWGIHRTGWRHKMETWWRNLSEGERIFVPICFLNVLVFLSWHIPAFRPTMYRYFCSNPTSNRCWPMLFVTFSHYSLLHLIINMYVLYDFCKIAVTELGREQFLALYLTSGVVSSFSSYLYKASVGIKDPSLGASGAIMGVLGFVCTQFPNVYLSIVFLPMLKFTASSAIKAVMGLDTVGCLMRWQRLDHAAHLGGALFGIFWQMWGNANIWQKREPVLVFWHQLREPPRSH
ncbi:presenilins-associated rhomboid-like protein, mitochondrial [Apis laboriosa]|uniref:rhomboid protease n=1 Tax=Apis mellifera TaxID=7460 RepID=A0A7M7L7V7_APIME|nr:presenilins-associated rhomboid-like protein, mitochondrial [Apis dorsata]XP_006624464.1 presenilins-associated rhomboid-like protein, mitochondrial [Apis dorsata]XP_026297138.1 presenilins-associated rhomboid-like protein, mitochondrial [Apis mellifera]XP_026297139.1 presenilins-associated rhomboid-like protein, mitochondrial [Apis mellifera]XP_043799878.1 presenilins-associated rhomboid-like protein, mitochondrial [Apis laboriosa]XP_043799879.1 presenilins-associated rhomboid-like protein|eukprot:XP_026297138.1 presenilins-associated rhomboid-like protein, mitochondrial [Apis mellifera]